MCPRCGIKPYYRRPVLLLSKSETHVKRWDSSQKYVETNPTQIQVSTLKRITILNKKIIIHSKHLQHRRGECFI